MNVEQYISQTLAGRFYRVGNDGFNDFDAVSVDYIPYHAASQDVMDASKAGAIKAASSTRIKWSKDMDDVLMAGRAAGDCFAIIAGRIGVGEKNCSNRYRDLCKRLGIKPAPRSKARTRLDIFKTLTEFNRDQFMTLMVMPEAYSVTEKDIARWTGMDMGKMILDIVCTVTNISYREMVSGSRVINIGKARFIFYYLVRKRTNLSLKQVGRIIGGRDHATVSHGFNRVASCTEAFEPELSVCDNLITRMITEKEKPRLVAEKSIGGSCTELALGT